MPIQIHCVCQNVDMDPYDRNNLITGLIMLNTEESWGITMNLAFITAQFRMITPYNSLMAYKGRLKYNHKHQFPLNLEFNSFSRLITTSLILLRATFT